MEESSLERNRYLRAKYRVSQLRNYYMHLLIYLVVNLFISGVKIAFALRAGDSFSEAAFSYNSLSVWVIWGLFLIIHTFRVVALPHILGNDWEYKKLEQFLNEELIKEQQIKK